MVQLTWIFQKPGSNRVEPLTLVADQGTDERVVELERRFRERAKAIATAASGDRAPTQEVVVDNGYYYLYISDPLVVYVVLCDRGYEKRLAYDYLMEISREFRLNYPEESIRRAVRPYEFTQFDKFIQSTKRLYLDTRSERNLDKLAHELGEVHSLMTRNLEEVIHRGAKIQTVQQRSEKLLVDSSMYAKNARQLNLQKWWIKVIPVALVIMVVLYFLFRWFYF